MTNEQTIADYLKEIGGTWVNIEWVLWALQSIESANRNKVRINPEYLRATHRFLGDTAPIIITRL